MRLILLALCMQAALPAHAAAPELLASLDALFGKRAEAASFKEWEDTLKKDGLEGKFNERLDAAIKINPDFERGSPLKAREAILKVKQGIVAYDPAEGRRVQEWAKKVEAKIAEELE